jgi:hypothetical protein
MESAGAQVLSPVESFFKVCMGSLGNQNQGEEIAQKLGLTPVAEEEKKALLRSGAAGSVYVGDRVADVLEAGGLCTVWAYAEDKNVVQEDLKNALPPSSTPFKVSTESIGDIPDVKTTVYHLVLPTGPFADWVLSTNNRPGKYNVAISLQLRPKS